MKLSLQAVLPAAVLPPVLGAVLAYPAMFFDTLERETRVNGVERHGHTISTGALARDFRYDITQKGFASTYRLLVSPAAARPGFGVCAVEVRGGPKPTGAALREGGFVQVAFEQPLIGYGSRSLQVNLAVALDQPCAATVSNGIVLAPTGLPHSVAALAPQVIPGG